MQYLDKTFWKMAAGFVLIVGVGLLGVYSLSTYRESVKANNLTQAAQ